MFISFKIINNQKFWTNKIIKIQLWFIIISISTFKYKQVACVRNLHKSSRVIEALSNNASMLKIDDNKIRFGIESIPWWIGS